MDNNINNRVHRILVSRSPSPPPPPPLPFVSCIAAATIAMLLFYLFVYVFSDIVNMSIVLFFIISVLLCMFLPVRPDFDIEIGERTIFYGQIPRNNKRVVRISDELFWVFEDRGGNRREQGSVKKLIGSVVCFGSQVMPSYSSGCSDCAICLEDFKEGEQCLVLPICDHIFHLICIHRWLENKHTCPICRHCIPTSAATMVTRSRSIELLANLV